MTVRTDWKPADLRHERRPLDIIGDVHGCAHELIALLGKLGYEVHVEGEGKTRAARIRAAHGRLAVFAGDLVDRGPNAPDVLRIVMAMVASGKGMCVVGNHDSKFLRWLGGRPVKLTHGLEHSAEQMEATDHGFRAEVAAFLERLPLYLWLADGRIVVAHAGIEAHMIGRMSDHIRRFCIYGDTDGQKDAYGLSQRYHWALDYKGGARVVYGHTPVPDVAWVNNTLCVDTGCCFGGDLTALRWPEGEIVTVPAARAYAEARRPFGHPPPRPKPLAQV